MVLSDVEIEGILADASVFDFVPETSLIAAIILIVRSRKIRSLLTAESQTMGEKIAGRRYEIYGWLAGLAIAIVFLPLLTGVAWLNDDADSARSIVALIVLPIVFLCGIRETFRSLTETCNGDVKKSRDEKILK